MYLEAPLDVCIRLSRQNRNCMEKTLVLDTLHVVQHFSPNNSQPNAARKLAIIGPALRKSMHSDLNLFILKLDERNLN